MDNALVIMKQSWMGQMKAEGRTPSEALKARYPSEDTNIRGYLSRCYHLDRQLSCLHQSPVQPKHPKSTQSSNVCTHKYTHTK